MKTLHLREADINPFAEKWRSENRRAAAPG